MRKSALKKKGAAAAPKKAAAVSRSGRKALSAVDLRRLEYARAFCACRCKTKAYLEVFPHAARWKKGALYTAAAEYHAHETVLREVERLESKADGAAVMDRREALARLSGIARGEITMELVKVTAGGESLTVERPPTIAEQVRAIDLLLSRGGGGGGDEDRVEMIALEDFRRPDSAGA